MPRGDRAAVEHHRGDVEPSQRHHRARDRLVAAGEGNQSVELVAAGGELDRVRDHLAADERGLHALAAHRDAVRDGDRVELHRVGARGFDALLQGTGEIAQPEVARHRLGPDVGDADERLVDVLRGQADRVEERARARAVTSLIESATRQLAGWHAAEVYRHYKWRSQGREM